ncbi:L-2-hydroxyglutarate oxidase [Methylocapsa acidiphila]|uniref:L-2-hydroxyglutarate oxidase n=1 Tax=Methylocapsa acidiphila TaxID=133552 RepID=UPI0003FE3E82|nr:L-2-hydroxyglutarate oxidase [Methylocapsa acidiphila]
MIYDFGVVGAGIVGLATAAEILRARPGASIIIFEKEDGIARHQTGHNSGVVHSGVYYTPGSLKARLCREGAEATKAFCAEHGVAIETCGKYLVATNAMEIARMDALHERAKQNGVEAERIDGAELARREPYVAGLAALFLPSTAIVDYPGICAALARMIAAAGGELRLGAEIAAITEEAETVAVSSAAETLRVKSLVVCAGLQSDRLARLAGVAINHQIVPFRGEFYALPSARTALVSRLIYPIPDPTLPFVGVHLTRTIGGGVIVGPNAMLGFAREGYEKFSFNLRDVAAYAAFPGFWRAIVAHLGAGASELRSALSKSYYLAQCRKYYPSLTLEDLAEPFAGIRAQAVLRDGTLAHDFLFAETPRMLHVCNAPSPAATSAIPIARMIAEKALARFAAA